MTVRLIHYTDFKSPYAFLAKDEIYRIADGYDVELVWRHYTLKIENYLDAVDERSAHNWRRVKYAYMDARRLANLQGKTLYGPQKIFDSRPAGIGMTYADAQGLVRPYADHVFERFFKRDIELGDPAAIEAALRKIGADTAGFAAWYEGDGAARHDRERAEAEEAGVFGVPTLMLEGELFWGGDRLWLLEARLKALATA